MWNRKFHLFLFTWCVSVGVFAIDPAPIVGISVDKKITEIDSIYSLEYYNGKLIINAKPFLEGQQSYSMPLGTIKFKLKNQPDYYKDSIKVAGYFQHIIISKKGDTIIFGYDKWAPLRENLPFFGFILIFLILKALLYYSLINTEEKSKFIKKIGLISLLFLLPFILLANKPTLFLFFIPVYLVFVLIETTFMAINYGKRGFFLSLIAYVLVALYVYITVS